MAKKNINYEEALEELEDIVDQLERGEIDIDELTRELKRAQELLKLCKDKLTKTDEEIKKMLENVGDK